MVRTGTSISLMGLLLDGKPVTDRQLADAIGFKNPRNIAKHLDSFVSSGYIRMLPRTGREESPLYQLTDKKEGLLNLYQSRFYRVLRPASGKLTGLSIRWRRAFCPFPTIFLTSYGR